MHPAALGRKNIFLMKKAKIFLFLLFFLIISRLNQYLGGITRAVRSYDPFLKISNIDYYQSVCYSANWAQRKKYVLGNTTLTTARMYADQYVAVLDLPDGPPRVNREILHRTALGEIRDKASGSKSAKLPLGDETCGVRSGTALVTSGNFRQTNGWHQMVSFNAHWQAMRTVEGKHKKVDYLVLSTEGEYPATSSPYSQAWKIFYRNKALPDNARGKCYKRIIFTDLAPHQRSGWVGGLWNLARIDNTFEDTMTAHPEFVDDFRDMHSEILEAVEPRVPRVNRTLCYIKRKVGGRRGFRDHTAEHNFVDLFKPDVTMDFKPNVPPVSTQVRSINQCTTIVGIHGAGLSYMFWADPGLNVVELGDNNTCRGYYRHMAKLLGHSYACVGIGSLSNPEFTELWTNHLSPSVLRGKTSLFT